MTLAKRLSEDPKEISENQLSLQHSAAGPCTVGELQAQAIIETVADGIISIAADGKIRFVNSAAEKIFGYKKEELLGVKVNILIPPPHQDRHDSYIESYINTGLRKIIGYGRQVEGRRKDGTVFPLDLAVSEVIVDGQRLFSGILRDITESVQAAEALQQREAELRALTESAPCMIVMLRQDLSISHFSPFAEELTGYSADDVIGRNYSEIFLETEYRDNFVSEIESNFKGIPTRGFEIPVRCRDGAVRWMVWNSTLIESEGSEPTLLAVGQDISERHEVEKEIRRQVAARTKQLAEANKSLSSEIAVRTKAQTDLQESLREKEVLLKEVHHRVKNNLQLISSLLKLHVRRAKGVSTDDLVKDIHNRIQSIALLHEMLYQAENLGAIDFGSYLETLAQSLLRYYGMSRQVNLEVNVHPLTLDLECSIICGLIVNELITNSLKHAFPGERKGNLNLSVELLENSSFILTVRDDGIGLPDDIDLKNTSTLGLELVQKLTKQLGGQLEIERAPGTKFSIRLPIAGGKK